jgi:alcohol dehydrogenase
MKALVFHGPNTIAWEEVPDARLLEPTDAVVQVDTTTICGTDLHILHGDVPSVTDGRVLGHEGVGTIVAVGDGVTSHAVGERVIISCISGCGVCTYCRSQNPSHCLAPEGASGIGWVLGHLIDGTQAELVRVPFADSSLHRLPPNVPDELAVLLSDILPTGFEIGVRYGHVQPGDTVAVVGAGPVGLAAVATAGLYGAAQIIAIDTDSHRLDVAKRLGATVTVDASAPDWKSQVLGVTDDAGVDVAIECVGIPQTFTMCTELVRPGGHVANVGVHGTPAELALQDLWIRNITITTGLVNTTTLPMLLRLVAAGKLPVEAFVTHRFDLADIVSAYDTFGRAAQTQALKVLLSR